jgi:hypothetical protein
MMSRICLLVPKADALVRGFGSRTAVARPTCQYYWNIEERVVMLMLG